MHSTLSYIRLMTVCMAGLCACQQAEVTVENPRNVPIVPAEGKVLPKESIADPEIIPVDWSAVRTMVPGEPDVVPIKGNTQPLGDPIIVTRITKQICIPGQDTFKLPEVVPAIDSPYVVGIPKAIAAKDPVVRERNPYGFSALRKHEGLSSNWILEITQDRLGNIWFATGWGGVCRYDGQSFAHFDYDSGFPLDFVQCVLEDHEGNIWFGAWGKQGGIIRFDGRKISHFTEDKGLVGLVAQDIIEDRHGNLWVATRGYAFGDMNCGVSRYDGDIFTNFTMEQGLLSNVVNCLYEDKNGNIWIGTGSGLNMYDGEFMYRYLAEDGENEWVIADIQEDRSGNLWLGTVDQGMVMFDGSSYIRYSSMTGVSDVRVWDIHKDRSGNIWFGTEGKGLVMLDSLSIFTFTKDDGLFDDRVNCITEDRNGRLWIGTHDGGAMVYSGGIFKHLTEQDGLYDNTVAKVVQDRSGNFWFAMSNGGVARFDGTSIARYGIEQGLLDLNIWWIHLDRHGSLWWGGNGGGVTQFNGSTFTNYTGESGVPYVTFDMLEDASGDLWMGTWTQGVTRFDGQTFTGYQPAEGVFGQLVRVVFEDSKGNLWIGSENPDVLAKYDGETYTLFTTEAGLAGNMVWDIYEDPQGNLWFANYQDGISVYDGERFFQLNENVGFSHSVYKILEDRQGNLWFSSGTLGEGISRLAAADREEFMEKVRSNNLGESDVFITTYTYDDGFLGRSSRNMYEDNDGRIWVSTPEMLTVFDPDDAAQKLSDTTAPSIQLIDIILFNEQVDWRALEQNRDTILVLGNGVQVKGYQFDSLSPWYGMPQGLSLSHKNNHVSFSFVGVTSFQADQVKYQYKLEGQDENWSRISDRTEVPYGNLSPGNYVFKVKARGSTGTWSEEFHFPFTIRPPWWQTWWAYGVYCILLLFGIWQVHIFQRARVIRKEREKTREREVRQAKAIEKAYQELEISHENLKATQAQLIQSEKMASLGEMTAGIAHEIQNPLNFVNNFSEVNQELLEEMQEAISKGDYEEALSLSKALVENEKKVIQHGKRADGIVKSMLQHSRGSSGQKEPVNLNVLCDEYLRLAYHGLRAKDKTFNAKFHTELDPSLPEVEVVPQDFGRVVLNLINNAFYAVTEKRKHADPGYKPGVSVSTHNLDKALEIRVRDNGNGIPQDIVDKLFQPFFTTKPTGQGTGLGLSLSYDIVKAHGGSLKVESTEGEGAVFTIQLPLNS